MIGNLKRILAVGAASLLLAACQVIPAGNANGPEEPKVARPADGCTPGIQNEFS